jgi:hypothetical protein
VVGPVGQSETGHRTIVTELAAKLDTPRTPEAVFVFMAWMGDPL